MADFRFSVQKPALAACALVSAALMASCSSIEHTPMEQLTAVQTVTPLAKPGTEMTAYALPTPDGAATATAAALAAETATMTPIDKTARSMASAPPAAAPGANAIAAGARMAALDTSGTVPGVNPLLRKTAAGVLPESANAMASVEKVSVAPGASNLRMAAMDSDFDSGEPVGLETLVARRMIVPAPKPQLIAAAYAKVEAAATALLGSDKPTSSRPELDRLISQYAKLNGVPEDLVHRVVRRESTYNPRAFHNGNYGLMQIRYNTARGLGYNGPPEGLFDAETNLKYATQYLRGAWVVAENQNDNAVKLYASGYYYHAKRKGLLDTLNMR